MNAWRQLLSQVVLRQRAQGSLWLTWALLALLPLPLAGAASGALALQAACMVAGGLASGVVLLWWTQFLQTAMRLNHPAAACLVPGLRRRLMVLATGCWLIASLPPAALFGGAVGHVGYAFLISAASLQYMALCGRYPWLAFVPSLVWLATLVPGFSGGALAVAVAGIGETAFTLAGLLALLALGAVLLPVLLPRGGDAHHRIDACIHRHARNLKEGRLAGPHQFFTVLDVFYRARLAAPGRPGPRLLDGLGARAHWSAPVLSLAVLAAATIAWRSVADAGKMAPFLPLVFVAMLMVVISHVDGVLSSVAKSRVEQGILRLSPAAPRPRDLNRQLALALLGRFAILMGVYLACGIAVVLATTGAWRAWLCCAVVALAFAPLLLRDHARQAGWRHVHVVSGVLMLVMAPVGGLVEFGNVRPVPVLAGAAVLLAGTAIALALRWPRALAAPPAFPAGRMAT